MKKILIFCLEHPFVIIFSVIIIGGLTFSGIVLVKNGKITFGAPTQIRIAQQTLWTTDLVPDVDNAVDLGSNNKTIRNGYFGGLMTSGSFVGDSTASISGTITFGNLISCDTIDSSATGLLSCGTDASGTGAAIVHSLMDSDWHGDTLLASVSQGSLIVGNATPKWSELVIDVVSGSFLQSDGTTAYWNDYQDQNTTYTAGDNLTLTGTDFDVDDPFAVVHASASGDFSTPSGQITSASIGTLELITDLDISSYTNLTAGDHITLTDDDLDVDDDFLLNTGDTGTWVSLSADFQALQGVIPSLSATTTFTGAGLADCDTAATSKLLWSDTGVFSCGTDSNSVTAASDPLSLIGTTLSIDTASAGDNGVLSAANWSTFNNKLDQAASTSFVWSPTTTTNAFELNGLASVSGLATFYGGILSSGSLTVDSTASLSGTITLGNLVSCNTIDSDATGLLACGTDDDVPEVSDFAALVGGQGIDNNSGTLDFDLTEWDNLVWASGSQTSLTLTVDLSGTDPVIEFGSDILRTSASWSIDDAASLSGAFNVGSLKSCDTIDTDANGLFACGTDATGGGSGMVTHGLLSDEWHNDVSNASASAGALIYGAGTTWTPLAVGASDSFLFSDGVNPIYKLDPDIASMSITDLKTSTLTGTLTGALTGNASTATKLAANGANCNAGEYNLGVDDSGAAETCTDATTEINSVINGAGGTNLTCSAQSCDVDDAFLLNTGDTGTWASLTVGFSANQAEITSLSATTLLFPADSITEANINFATTCNSSSKLYIDSGNLACNADATGGAGGEVHGLLNTDWHTDVLLASVSEGSVIVGNATPKWAAVGKGASGSFLGGDGTDTLFTTNTGNIDIYGTASVSGAFTLGSNLSGIGASLSDDLDLADLNVTSASIGTLYATTFSPTSLSVTHVSVSDDFESLYSNLSSVSITNTFTLAGDQLWNTSNSSNLMSSHSWQFSTGTMEFDNGASLSGTLDLNNVGLITNIGDANTDFISGGGLNIAGTFGLATDQIFTTSNTGNVLSSHSWQFSTGQSVEFDGTASTSGNWTINNGVWDMSAIGSFSLGTSQLFTTSKTSEVFSSASWTHTTGALSFDNAASTSGAWTINTGAWDFTNATSLKVPTGTAPSITANGQVAVDTTGGQFLFYSDEVNVLMATKSFAFNYGSGSFDLTNNQQYVQFHEPITITAIDCFVTSGTSAQIEIEECDANGANCATTDAAITCTTSDVADDGSLSNASIDALDWVIASISQGDVSGDVDSVHINVHFKYTAQ